MRRAIGIVRVSQTAGRAGESFTSPETQRERIEAECERQGLQLVEVLPEMDVSGGKPQLGQMCSSSWYHQPFGTE
jgi:DNA invertase Pin-like site-specific DNA recombinase